MLPQLGLFSPRELATALLDMAIVSFLVYRVFMLIRGTRAVQLIKGLVILLLVTVVSQRLSLVTLSWLMDKALVMLLVALPVVFQPELRRGLEQLGRGRFFGRPGSPADVDDVVREVTAAAAALSLARRGALFVIERRTGLADIIETGTLLHARLSSELLVSLFIAEGPLHDGAVIIRGTTVMAAGCFLPLTDSLGPKSPLGSRHRAALGVTEQTDCVAVVVSEETGMLSVGSDGGLTSRLDPRGLSRTLTERLTAGERRRGVSL